MSYVITSNIDVNYNNKLAPIGAAAGLNLPYSYSNSMDTMFIEPDSEIAVQSVKVNREGNFTLSQANNTFALYYGETSVLTGNQFNYIDDSMTQPTIGTIRGESGGQSSTFNTDDFARAIQESFRLFTFHPSYQLSDLNTSGTLVSASRVANEGFKGFNFTFTQYSGSANSNSAASLVTPLIVPRKDNVISPALQCTASGTTLLIENTQVVTAAADTLMGATILGNRPISLVGGKLVVDLEKYNNGSNSSDDSATKEFSVGLTRAQKNYRVYNDIGTGEQSPYPPYFKPDNDDPEGGYYDYVVSNVAISASEAELRIYHAVNQTTEPNKLGSLEMKEVRYPSSLTDNARYRVADPSFSATGKSIRKIEFEVIGEAIVCRFLDTDGNSGSGTDHMAFSSLAAETAVSGSLQPTTKDNQRLKPINTCCWSMYPKINVAGYGTGADPGAGGYNLLKIETFNGVLPSNHQYGGLYKPTSRPLYMSVENDGIYDSMTDFYSYQENLGGFNSRSNQVQDTQTTAINYFDSANTNTVRPQKTLETRTGGKKFIQISDVLIMAQSMNYPLVENPRLIPNVQRILGFPQNPVIEGIHGPAGAPTADPRTIDGSILVSDYDSDTVMKGLSGESNFIRVRNLTQTTNNVANRSLSKIIYHIPKFGMTGDELGSLYFEPPERTYVKLNNPSTLNINSFDVDIVNAREQLANSYSGTTVVCFHIRKSNQ